MKFLSPVSALGSNPKLRRYVVSNLLLPFTGSFTEAFSTFRIMRIIPTSNTLLRYRDKIRATHKAAARSTFFMRCRRSILSVKCLMFSPLCKQQITRVIIHPIFVDMVDLLVRFKLSAKTLLHDMAMLKHSLTIDGDSPIANKGTTFSVSSSESFQWITIPPFSLVVHQTQLLCDSLSLASINRAIHERSLPLLNIINPFFLSYAKHK